MAERHHRVPLSLNRPPRPGQDTVPIDFIWEHPPPDAAATTAHYELADIPEDFTSGQHRHHVRALWRTTQHLPADLYAGSHPLDKLAAYMHPETT